MQSARRAFDRLWPHARIWIAIFIGYAALAAVMFWPVLWHFTSALPKDLGDPLLNTYILWWNAQHVPFSTGWWNAPYFWPTQGTMGFSETLVGLSALATPMLRAGANPFVAYNTLFVLSWPLSALAAHALAYHLVRRHDAAALGGLIFGFSPYRTAQISHVQVLASFWMPIALLALHAALEAPTRRRRYWWFACFGVAWLFQALTNGYFLFYFSVVVAAWLLWFATPRPRRAIAIGAIAALAAAATLMVPILWKYRSIHEALQLHRNYEEVLLYSADLRSFATSGALQRFWTLHPELRPEQELYPGIVAIGIVLGALIAGAMAFQHVRRPPAAAFVRRLSFVAAAMGFAFLISVVWIAVKGPWEWTLGPFSLVGRSTERAFLRALLLLLIPLAFSRRLRDAVRTRSAFAFYFGAAVLCAVMCFGPEARAFGVRLLVDTPYRWLAVLPGFASLRVPTRFAMPGILCLSVCAAVGAARLIPPVVRVRRIAMAVLVAAVVLDSWPLAVAMHAAPDAYGSLPSLCGSAVVELPVGDVLRDTSAMYRSMTHLRPLVNGYSGYYPLPYDILRFALAEGDSAVLRGPAAFASLCIAVDSRFSDAAHWMGIAEEAGARASGASGPYRFFSMPQQSRGTGGPPPTPTRLGRLLSSTWKHRVDTRIDDGDLTTFWTSRTTQRGDESISFSLARAVPVVGVVLDLGDRVDSYPRYLTVDVSPDNVNWDTVWQGATSPLAYVAAAQDAAGPHRLILSFPEHLTLAVRMRQRGRSATAYWSVAELGLLLDPVPDR